MSRPKINLRRILVLGGTISLLVVYPILYARMLSSPRDRTGADFISLYTAGRAARLYGLEEVYNLDLQRTIQQDIVGFELAPDQVLLYNHMPYIIPLLGWMTSANYVSSFVRWSLFSIILYAIAIFLLQDVAGAKTAMHKRRSLYFIGAITFYPLFVSIVNGQDTPILFLGAALWVWGFSKEKDAVAGLGLALATIRPHIALMLSLPFLFKRRKVWWWFLASATVLGLFSILLIGPGGVKSFMTMLLLTAGGDWFGMHQSQMVNVLGLTIRLFPTLPEKSLQAAAWGFYLLAILGLCILWIKSRQVDLRHLATEVLVAILFVPHLHYHDLTLLLIPVTILILCRDDLPLLKDLPELPLIVSMLLLFSSSVAVVKLSIPYLVIAVLLVLLWLPKRFLNKAGSLPDEESSPTGT